MKKIAVVGHFGGKEKFNDGQTIKTIAIYDALERAGVQSVDKVDTYFIHKNPMLFICKFIVAIIKNKQFIVLLSSKGRKVLFPFFYLLSKVGKRIYHYGIGGRLAREVEQKKHWKKYVSSFEGNWMESRELVERLKEMGISNAIYIPNFKNVHILNKQELKTTYNAPYKIFTIRHNIW